MTGVSSTYILYAPEGFQLPYSFSVTAGIIIAVVTMGIYIKKIKSTHFEEEIMLSEQEQAV
jgi:hypothetical protein